MRRVVDGVLALYSTGASGVPQIRREVVGACVRRLFEGVAVRVITSASTPSRVSHHWLLSTPVGAEGLPQRFVIEGLADDRRAADASC